MNGVPFNQLDQRINSLQQRVAELEENQLVVEGLQETIVMVDGEFNGFRNLNLHGQTNVVDDGGVQVAAFNTDQAIIAILYCPEDDGIQSLAVTGPARFTNDESGSFMQLNRCNHDAPVAEIGWNHEPNHHPGEAPAMVFFNPNDPTNATFLSPSGAEIQDNVRNLRTCLNSIELLVRCGRNDVPPAGVMVNLETLNTHSYADYVQSDELSADSGFIREITTFDLIEIGGTDNPY